MSTGKLFPIVTQAGIKRDGARLAGNYYVDGQHCRFKRGMPRKMGGFKQLYNAFPNVIRNTYVIPVSPNFNVYFGDSDSLKYLPIDQFGTVLGPLVDRTPAGFAAHPDNNWQFSLMFDTTTNKTVIIAHAGRNVSNIDNNVETPIYMGDVSGALPLTETGQTASGGVVTIGNYLFMLSSDGLMKISEANNPAVLLNQNRTGGQKFIYGLPIRAGNSAPGGLFWSLNSVVRVTLVQTTPEAVFAFDTITEQSSILSSSSIIDYDGIIFWCAIDRFMAWNGTVQEVPNNLNLEFFFNNVNFAQRQKVWATKVPEYGEIWFHYPSGNSTECDRAVIYNKRENTWYDTIINRSSGYYDQVFADPIWTDNGEVGPFAAWIHEIGNDQDINGTLTAIPSFFETGDISWCAVGPAGNWNGTDRWVDLERIEPEFWRQSGDIDLTVNGQEFANSPVVSSSAITLTPLTTKEDIRQQRRFMTLRFDSNEIGGFYELGQTLILARIGDARA